MLFRSEDIVFLRVMTGVFSSEMCSGKGSSLGGGLAEVGLGVLLSSRAVSSAVAIALKSISPSVKSIS